MPQKWILAQQYRTLLWINYLALGVLSQNLAQNCITSAKQQGFCTILEGCPNIIEEYFAKIQTAPVSFDAFLKSIACDNNGITMRICCPIRNGGSASQPLAVLPSQTQPPPLEVKRPPPGVSIFHFSALNYNTGNTMGNAEELSLFPLYILPGGTANLNPISSQPSQQPLPWNTPPLQSSPPLQPSQPSQPLQQLQPLQPLPGQSPSLGTIKLSPGAIPISASGQCGVSTASQTRIVGGNEARKGSYSWMAALGYMNNADTEFLCGGSLITTRHVVTAAHCITNALSFVRLGAHDLSMKEANAVDVKISKKFPHENYNSNTIANDIAVIKLERDVEVNDFIQPICLPYNIMTNLVGLNPFIAGWGAQKFRGRTSNALREVQVPIVANADCKRNYSGKILGIVIDDQLICAGTGQTDACQGDSGGPLMLPQINSVKVVYYYYLIGIVSFGFECAVPGFPGVYTRVSAHLPWIENKVKL